MIGRKFVQQTTIFLALLISGLLVLMVFGGLARAATGTINIAGMGRTLYFFK